MFKDRKGGVRELSMKGKTEKPKRGDKLAIIREQVRPNQKKRGGIG